MVLGEIRRIPFKLLDKVTPAFLQNKIALLVDELGNYIQSGGKYLINEQAMIQKSVTILPHSIF